MPLHFILPTVAEKRGFECKDIKAFESKSELNSSCISLVLITSECAILELDEIGKQLGAKERKQPNFYWIVRVGVPIEEAKHLSTMSMQI